MIVSARERVRPTRRLKDVFRADHQRIERVVLRLLAAFEANDREDIARLWTELDTGLLLHFAVEEKSILPELLLRSPRDAGVIVSEHRHLRARLAELGVSIDLHLVRLEIARHFVEELRAHALSEERILYGSSDTVVGERERRSTLRALEGEAASTATAPENHHPRL